MNAKQPNFEKVKTLFYQSFINSNKATNCILLENIKSTTLRPSFYTRTQEFKKDLYEWLNSIDIRQVGSLIDECVKVKAQMPEWMKNKAYLIDYNDNGFLDLIPSR